MEKKKLLRILTLTLTLTLTGYLLASSTIWATEEDVNNWAKDLAKQRQQISAEHLRSVIESKEFDAGPREALLKPRPVLQIFVSSSMPKQLLQNYAKEAHLYNGTLVFAGLLEGSFMQTFNLITEISDQRYPAAMQIDDQAFALFDIKTVPTIVLTAPQAMDFEQTIAPKFDKVSGSITVKAALELFAADGDCGREARQRLAK